MLVFVVEPQDFKPVLLVVPQTKKGKTRVS